MSDILTLPPNDPPRKRLALTGPALAAAQAALAKRSIPSGADPAGAVRPERREARNERPLRTASAGDRPRIETDQRTRRALACLTLLRELCPRAFRDPPPALKVGIKHDVLTLLAGEFSKAEIKQALRIWTQRAAYRSAVAAGAPRVNLDGIVVGTVLPEEVRAPTSSAPGGEPASGRPSKNQEKPAARMRRALDISTAALGNAAEHGESHGLVSQSARSA